MKALVFEPGRPGRYEPLDGFDGITRRIGGYVERVILESLPGGRNIELWCDEDGLIKGSMGNLMAFGRHHPQPTPIVGTAVVTMSSVDEEGESIWYDLPLEQVFKLMELPRFLAPSQPKEQ